MYSIFENNPILARRPRLKIACQKLYDLASALNSGDKLPTMRELRSQTGISLRTLNDAVRQLEKYNILHSINGVGIYVADFSPKESVHRVGLLFRVGEKVGAYGAEVLSGIRQEGVKHNLEIILLDPSVETIKPHSLDSLVIICHETEALVLNIPEGMPHVLLFEHSPNFTCVVPDDFEGAKMATEYFLKCGHRRIAYLPAPECSSIARQRLGGYYAAHREAGISVNPSHIRHLPTKDRSESYQVQGKNEMTKWLAENWEQLDCSALLAQNDKVAIGAIQALQNGGLTVPDDVSVIGFDGTEISELCSPPLTTVKVPLAEIGARAIKVLLAQLQGKQLQTEKITLPVQLKLGKSVVPASLSSIHPCSG